MNPLYFDCQTCELKNEQYRKIYYYYYYEVNDFELFGLIDGMFDDWWMHDKKKKGSFDGFYFDNESKLRYFNELLG